MEQTKYLDPKFSYSFDDLTGLLKSNGDLSDSTRISRISAAERINVKRKNYKSLPISPKRSRLFNRSKNESQKVKLKYFEKSELACSPPLPESIFQENERRKVTSTKRERMAILIPEFTDMKNTIKEHNISHLPKDFGLQLPKKNKTKQLF